MRITDRLTLPDSEIQFSAIRARGAGGQNVNKVATAIHLRFDIRTSSLPASVKQRLLKLKDGRITADGVVVIKSQAHRTQERNRAEAMERLRQLVLKAAREPRRRIPTKPSQAARKRRMDEKKKRSETKRLRAKP